MPAIRAKFIADEITTSADGTQRIKLRATTFPEASALAKATPSGNMDITINNPEALGFFVAGSSYYLDITEAPKS